VGFDGDGQFVNLPEENQRIRVHRCAQISFDFLLPSITSNPIFKLYLLIGAFCRGGLSLITSNLACGEDHREGRSLPDNTCNLDISVEVFDDSIANPQT
jgi:hypothetical protein